MILACPDQRAALMRQWADYATGESAQGGGAAAKRGLIW